MLGSNNTPFKNNTIHWSTQKKKSMNREKKEKNRAEKEKCMNSKVKRKKPR
jgi:hypothetical protein